MKTIIFTLLVIVLVATSLWYMKSHRSVKAVSTMSTYRNTETGISFTYPKTLIAKTLTDSNNTAIIHHEIPFVHKDYCDFKGDGTGTIPTLADFNVRMHVDNLDLISAIKKESPYIPAENFVNNQVIPSPGFIDPVTHGKLSGFKIYEGAEGCRHIIYYFAATNNKTLVVVDDVVTIFTGAIDANEGTRALTVPGVISKQTHDSIFDSILKTVSVQ